MKWFASVLVSVSAAFMFYFVFAANNPEENGPTTSSETYTGDYGHDTVNGHFVNEYKVEIRATTKVEMDGYMSTNFTVRMWRMQKESELPAAITAAGLITNESPESMKITYLAVINPKNESCQFFWTLRPDLAKDCGDATDLARTRLHYENLPIPPMMYAQALATVYSAAYRFYAPFHNIF